MATPKWFELKITLGNVLTLIPLFAAVAVAYSDVRSDQALMKQGQAEQRQRIEKLEARDDIIASQFVANQTAVTQALARLEAQMNILFQERRAGQGGAR